MRLIDGDALKEVMKAVLLQSIFAGDDEEEKQAIKRGEQLIRECVNECPTIDAVQVVRCRECRCSEKIEGDETSVICGYWRYRSRGVSTAKVPADGFCDFGAKMDEK